jgi:methionyl aminopeptidase
VALTECGARARRDRSRTAQFEHTLLVTEDGAEILTRA